MRALVKVRGCLIIAVIFLSLFSGVSPIFAFDYVQEGRLTKRTPEMINLSNYLYNQITFAEKTKEQSFIIRTVLWIENNINNSEQWITSNFFYSASWSFENKKGTCSERSVLFCAVVREKDIPCKTKATRVWNGYNHVYTQVYLDGKWLVVDPSLGIILEIDPWYPQYATKFKYLDPNRDMTKAMKGGDVVW